MITEAQLDQMLVTPSNGLVEDMKKIEGDIMIIAPAERWDLLCACWRKMRFAKPE